MGTLSSIFSRFGKGGTTAPQSYDIGTKLEIEQSDLETLLGVSVEEFSISPIDTSAYTELEHQAKAKFQLKFTIPARKKSEKPNALKMIGCDINGEQSHITFAPNTILFKTGLSFYSYLLTKIAGQDTQFTENAKTAENAKDYIIRLTTKTKGSLEHRQAITIERLDRHDIPYTIAGVKPKGTVPYDGDSGPQGHTQP